MKKLIILLLTLISYNSVSKIRLPEIINEYQPALLPIISPNGDELFFSRKWHPENTGGISDDDDVWVSIRKSNNEWNKPVKLEETINKPTSNSLLYIFPDGNKVLLSGEYYKKEAQLAITQINVNYFAIAKRINGKWQKPEPLFIEDFYNKSKNYSATISTDGKVLIMSLQREDSFGSLDLYISFYNPETKTFSKPANLGNKINSKGVEIACFLAYDSKTLYFASNGRNGKGKFDLYLTRRLDDTWGNWSDPIPLDFINSQWDENSLSLNLTGDTAYFTSGDSISGREGIYFAVLPNEFRPLPYLVIQGEILSVDGNSTAKINVPAAFKIDNFETDYVFYDTVYNSNYRFVVPNNTQYNFFVSAKNYNDYSFSTSSSKFVEPAIQNYNITLRRIKENKTFIGRIYFETDKDSLNKKSFIRLKKLIEKINQEKLSKILVVGHTDELGTEEYNLQLSIRRAENTAKVIKSILNLPDDIFEIQGKGKSEPISRDFSKNRRVEIYLVGYE
ncbi:MAG: OmpA family protein [Ignavibacteria bacterium]|nr:OmpA family protein [Ignavibacteria bacterium]